MNAPDRTTLATGTTPSARSRALDRAMKRASDAPLRGGNEITLLRNGPATYEDWLAAIGRAERWVHLENYIFKADRIGYPIYLVPTADPQGDGHARSRHL